MKFNIKDKKTGLMVSLIAAAVVILVISFIVVKGPKKNEEITFENTGNKTLVINIDKNQYLPGEEVYIQMASLDDQGNTLCNSKLEIVITNNLQPTPYNLPPTTYNLSVFPSTTCSPDNNVTNSPDYYAYFIPKDIGIYKITLKNIDTGNTVKTEFEVRDNPPDLSVTRWSATRINPSKSSRYPMVITVTANEDFIGTISDTIPESYSFAWTGPGKVEGNSITWEAKLKKGEKTELKYEYIPEKVSPKLFTIGPIITSKPQNITNNLQLTTYNSTWYIASDSVITSKTTGGDWNVGGSWVGEVAPGTGDSAVIATTGASTIVLTSSPTVLALTINSGSILTNNSTAQTLTLTTTSVTPLTNSGTFTPSTYITIVVNGAAAINPVLSGTWTGSSSFYNLEFRPALGTTARTYTMGTAFTVNGNMILYPTTSSERALTVTLSGTSTVVGTTTLNGTGCNDAGDSTSGSSVLNTNAQTFSSGKIDIKENAEFCILTGSAATITLTGTSGTLLTNPNAGSFTQSTSTINVTSTSGPVQLFSAAETIYNLTINSSSATTVVNSGATPTFASSGALTITSGVLNFDTGVTGPGNSTLTIGASGTLCLGGTAAATNTSVTCNTGATSTSAILMPSFTTYTFDASSTVIFLSDIDLTAANVISRIAGNSYGNLYLYPTFVTTSRAYTFETGTLSIAGNFTINPNESGAGSPVLTVNLGGTTTIAAGKTTTITATNSAASNLNQAANTNTLSSGKIDIATKGTLTAITTGTITLTATSGTLFTRDTSGSPGTFTQASSTISVTSASGPVQLFSSTNTIYSLTINSAAATTVVNSGATPTFASGGALTVTSGVLNFDTGVTGPGNSTLTIGASGTMCLGGTLAATNTSVTCNTGATSTTAIPMPSFTTYTFDAASKVIYLSDADLTAGNVISRLAGGSYGNLYLYPTFVTTSRSYTLETGTVGIAGDLIINPDESGAGSPVLTVNLGGTTTIAAGKTTTITATHSASSILDVNPGSSYDFSTGLLVTGTGGTLDATSASSTITLTGTSGTLFSNSGTFTITSGTPTVSVTGGTGTTLNSGTITFYNLTISPSGTSTINAFTDDLTVTNTLNVATGDTFSLPSGQDLTHSGATLTLDGTISGSGRYIYQSATAFPATGVISSVLRMDSTNNDQTMSGTQTYGGNVEIYNNSTSARVITLGTAGSQTLTYSGDVTLNAANSGSVSLTASATYNPAVTISTGNLAGTAGNGTENITTGTGTWIVGGSVDLTNVGTFTATGGTFQMNGASKTLTSSGKSFNNYSVTGGSVQFADTTDIDADLAITSGTLDLNGQTITIGGSFDNDAAMSHNNASVTFNAASGAKTIDADGTGADAFYDITFDQGTSASWQITGALDADHNFTITDGTVDANALAINVGNNWANSGGTFTSNSNVVTMDAQDAGNTLTGTMTGTSSFYDLVFNDGGSSGAWSFAANSATITHDFTITAGVVTAPSTTLTIGEDFRNNEATGSFVNNSGTVTFNTTNPSYLLYAATTTFYHLIISTATKQVYFEDTDGVVTDINGSLTIQGTDCDINRVFLNSNLDDEDWEIDATDAGFGNVDIDYADVEDSTANGDQITANNSTADNLGNTNWSIVAGACNPVTPNQPNVRGNLKIKGGVRIL